MGGKIPKYIEEVYKKLESKAPQLRLLAVQVFLEKTLEEIGEDQLITDLKHVIKLLLKIIQDENQMVRSLAEKDLGSFIGLSKDEEALQELISFTKKGKPLDIRLSAMKALEGAVEVKGLHIIWDRSIITTFIDLLGDVDNNILRVAATCLGNLRDKEAIEPLKKLLKDKDPKVRSAAQEALEQLG